MFDWIWFWIFIFFLLLIIIIPFCYMRRSYVPPERYSEARFGSRINEMPPTVLFMGTSPTVPSDNMNMINSSKAPTAVETVVVEIPDTSVPEMEVRKDSFMANPMFSLNDVNDGLSSSSSSSSSSEDESSSSSSDDDFMPVNSKGKQMM